MDADLDTLATALYVRVDDLLKISPDRAPARPRTQRQDALPDPGQDASWCSSPVAFEVELAFEGVEHRLDCLP